MTAASRVLPEHAGDLSVGDVMHGPRVRHEGRLRKTYLISILDAATRYLVGSTFRFAEAAVDHEAVLRQTFRCTVDPGRTTSTAVRHT